MLGLIIGDLYEDATNTPLVKTENNAGKVAQTLPVMYAMIGRIGIPQDPEVRNRMLKYFILLQNEPNKMASNRERMHNENREDILKRVNPYFLLDELKL